MKHFKWQVLTFQGAKLEGVDDMPNQGVRDATHIFRLEVKGYPVVQLVCVPHGADLIFHRSTEIPTDANTGRCAGRIVTYHVGWNYGGRKCVTELGYFADPVKLWRRLLLREKPTIKPFATMKDDDGRKD